VLAKRVLTRLIYFVVGLQLVLCVVDRFPFGLTLLGTFSHVIYLGNMRRFPYVKLSDPLFLVSCGKRRFFTLLLYSIPVLTIYLTGLVLLNHYLWFRHFSALQQTAYGNMSYYDQPDVPTFTEIASYFGLCVWLIPFALFVSLSASDNVLPTMGSEDPMRDSDGKNKRQGMVKALVDNIRDGIGEVFRVVGRGDRS
jgi:hypothetical protein